MSDPSDEELREIETEEETTRSEIAAYLRDAADQLEQPGPIRLKLGEKQVSMEPTEPITFKLEAESDWSKGDARAKQSIEFELVWRRDVQTPEEGRLDVAGSADH